MNNNAGRKKTQLRLDMEWYFNLEDEELKSDWFAIHYKDSKEANRIRSMFFSLKKTLPTAANAIIDTDSVSKIIWIHR